MTKPTKEQIDGATDAELAQLIAEHCTGYDSRQFGSHWYYTLKDEPVVKWIEWQPHLPTEKGKAQAIDLAEKYVLTINFGGKYVYSRRLDRVFPADNSWQIAVLKACLYAEMER